MSLLNTPDFCRHGRCWPQRSNRTGGAGHTVLRRGQAGRARCYPLPGHKRYWSPRWVSRRCVSRVTRPGPAPLPSASSNPPDVRARMHSPSAAREPLADAGSGWRYAGACYSRSGSGVLVIARIERHQIHNSERMVASARFQRLRPAAMTPFAPPWTWPAIPDVSLIAPLHNSALPDITVGHRAIALL